MNKKLNLFLINYTLTIYKLFQYDYRQVQQLSISQSL
jgi:hypothetical protein